MAIYFSTVTHKSLFLTYPEPISNIFLQGTLCFFLNCHKGLKTLHLPHHMLSNFGSLHVKGVHIFLTRRCPFSKKIEKNEVKSFQWTIEGLQVDFPETFNLFVRHNWRVDLQLFIEAIIVSIFMITEAENPQWAS